MLFTLSLVVINVVCYIGCYISSAWFIAPFMFKEIGALPWQVHVLKFILFVIVQIISVKVSKASLPYLVQPNKEQQ